MTGTEQVDLAVPAEAAYLTVMRTATAGVATQLDLSVDEVDDLRIAVDEAGSILLNGQDHPDHELSTSFTVEPGRMVVRIEGPPTPLPDDDSYAWAVLHALAGQVTTGSGNGTSWIRLTRRAGGAAR